MLGFRCSSASLAPHCLPTLQHSVFNHFSSQNSIHWVLKWPFFIFTFEVCLHHFMVVLIITSQSFIKTFLLVTTFLIAFYFVNCEGMLFGYHFRTYKLRFLCFHVINRFLDTVLTFYWNLKGASSQKRLVLHEAIHKFCAVRVRLFEFFSIPQKIMILLIFSLECGTLKLWHFVLFVDLCYPSWKYQVLVVECVGLNTFGLLWAILQHVANDGPTSKVVFVLWGRLNLISEGEAAEISMRSVFILC